MNDQLYVWLEKEWFMCNQSKYHSYFKEWITNIVDSQIEYFDKMRINENVYIK